VEKAAPKPEEALPLLRDLLETHRLEMEDGALAESLAAWMREEHPNFDYQSYGFQEFAEFLNYAQDKLIVRIEPDEEKGLMVYLGAEFYPPAIPELSKPQEPEEEIEEPQPIVPGQPSMVAPTPPLEPEKPARKPRQKRATTKRETSTTRTGATRRAPRKRKTE
jgi:hypothetical protein